MASRLRLKPNTRREDFVVFTVVSLAMKYHQHGLLFMSPSLSMGSFSVTAPPSYSLGQGLLFLPDFCLTCYDEIASARVTHYLTVLFRDVLFRHGAPLLLACTGSTGVRHRSRFWRKGRLVIAVLRVLHRTRRIPLGRSEFVPQFKV